mgnify:FL=1
MKTFKVLLISMFIFALLMGGLFIVQTQASTIEATAKCVPPRWSLEDPAPESFKITLTLPKPYKHEDIDPSTLLVGEVVPMMEEEGWPKIKKNYFKFKVDGEQLLYWVVLPRIWHMAPPPATWVDIDIAVTGQLYDETPFEGTFTLLVRTESLNPGPPPL